MQVGGAIARSVGIDAWSDEKPSPGSHDQLCWLFRFSSKAKVRLAMLGRYLE